MPIYTCNSGECVSEPWRHGIHVYAAPFDVDSVVSSLNLVGKATKDLIVAVPVNDTANEIREQGPSTALAASRSAALAANRDPVVRVAVLSSGDSVNYNPRHSLEHNVSTSQSSLVVDENANSSSQENAETSMHNLLTQSFLLRCHPIRRVRHAEVVLVDDVCIAFDRYWLRLRWPGTKGGFAGYIAMGRVSDYEDVKIGRAEINFSQIRKSGSSDDRGITDDADQDDTVRDDMAATPPSEPFDPETSTVLTCARTGLAFQTSSALRLLPIYDDGIIPRITRAPFPTEQIFCRICREGLHEDADTEQPSAATEDAEDTIRDISSIDFIKDNKIDNVDALETITASEPHSVGPIIPHPIYNSNSDALQNPMLAPCECAGSMAFVHYLCVEQWRCRSRHPDAHNGLNCETCGKPYALPPPSERPDVVQLEHEDWLDAMPPHVMQALRQPHIWWQLGAAIVRRRWLRPLAPVFMSPIVALYCRARRLLKKRGVARRRWACSLCRRRARWKCVRCLRSYYCSRQCQNVSWHIIHKHVCYKPLRFWWSVVVYGMMALLLFPGILRDPLMYDLGVCLIPLSFVIMGVLGGGVATLLKRYALVDIRGRLLELLVVVFTIWLCSISWGLVKGFFGDVSACYGTFGAYKISKKEFSDSHNLLVLFRSVVLGPIQSFYLFWDGLIISTSWLRVLFCSSRHAENHGCFEHISLANADFIFQELQGEKCASDLCVVIGMYVTAGLLFTGSAMLKKQERERRRQQLRRPARGEIRPHQD